MIDLYLINGIGILGLVFLLIGFYLEETGKAGKKHVYYNLLNLSGSVLLLLYAWYFKALIFVVLNIIWSIIAVYYLIKFR